MLPIIQALYFFPKSLSELPPQRDFCPFHLYTMAKGQPVMLKMPFTVASEHKIPWYKLSKIYARHVHLKLQNAGERNWRRPKLMERNICSWVGIFNIAEMLILPNWSAAESLTLYRASAPAGRLVKTQIAGSKP